MTRGFKKIIAAIALCFIIAQFFFFLLSPKPAEAYWGVMDTNITDSAVFQYVASFNTFAGKTAGTDTANLGKTTLTSVYTSIISKLTDQQFYTNLAKELVYQAWMAFRKMLLKMLVNDIVKWIQGGGSPRFVQDWQKFLTTAADKAGGQFVDQYLGLGFLCNSFDVRLKVALAAVPTFDESVKCTLTTMGININNFLNNFSNGGWRAWIAVNETQNNIYGAYMTALDKKISVESAASQAAQNEAIASKGFLGDKVCTKIYETNNPSNTGEFYAAPLKQSDIPAGWTCSEWGAQTPGTVIADATSQAVNIDIPWLLSAKEWREYASAIVDAMVNRVMKEGLALVATDTHVDSSASQPASANPTDYTNSIVASATASNLPDQLKLTKDNLNKVLAEYQNNLSYLNQIKNDQLGAFTTVKQLATSGCAMPAGVTSTNIGSQTTSNCNTTCPCTETLVTDASITIPGIGTSVLRQNSTSTFSNQPGDTFGTCLTLLNTSSNAEIINNNSSVDPEITAVTAAIDATTQQVNQINSLILKVQDYLTANDDYTTAWDNDPSVEKNGTSTEVAKLAMDTAKADAITALQTFLSSQSTDLNTLLTDAQTFSQGLAGKVYDISSKRGNSIGASCDSAQAGTYLTMSCAIESTKASLDAAWATCQQNQNNNGGNGAP